MQATWGIPQDSFPWTARPNVHTQGLTLSHRQLLLTNICFAIERLKMITAASQTNTESYGTLPRVDTEDLVDNLFLDVSQCIMRDPWGRGIPRPTRSTILYSFEKDRALSPHALMRAFGAPHSIAPSEGFTNAQLKDLAGEMCSIPIATAIGFAIYCWPDGDWWHNRDPEIP